MWSDFNEANRDAMLKSELISWPVTLAILVLAFGSLVAAGLPLMLTIVGLIASAGVLYLGTKLSPISIWAMNFALMFALALGIDYALFVVMRFRGALFGQHHDPAEAVGETMDTAGKAVLFSGLTVHDLAGGGDAGSEPGLPLGGAGNHGRGALRPGGDADAAAGGAGEARPADRQARPSLGAQRRAPLAPLRRAGASCSGGGRSSSAASRWSYCSAGAADPQHEDGDAVDQGRAKSDSSRVGYRQISAAFGPGTPGTLQVTAPRSEAGATAAVLRSRSGDRRGDAARRRAAAVWS